MRTGFLRAAFAVALPLLGACTPWAPDAAVGPRADVPGWTGRTQVVGSNSTIASNADATYLQQKWGVGQRR